jgi:acyl transferase domain-containing protein
MNRRDDRELLVFPLSAEDDAALGAVAARLTEHVARRAREGRALDAKDLRDLSHTYQVAKRALPVRRAVVARDADDLVAALAPIAAKPADGATTPTARPGGPRVAFVFTGQGCQFPGMGLAWAERFPAARAAAERLAQDPAVRAHLGVALADLWAGCDLDLEETRWTQPAIVAVELVLAQFLTSLGIHPAHTLGHSVGEIAAASVAGIFAPGDAVGLAAARGQLMWDACTRGSLVSAAMSHVDAEAIVALVSGVEVAVVNGPRQVVFGGQADRLEQLASVLAGRGVGARRVAVSHAFHTAAMAPILPGLAAAAARTTFAPAAIPLVTGDGGCIPREGIYGASDLLRSARHTVRFDLAVARLLDARPDVIVEIGPKPVLERIVRASVPTGVPVFALASVPEDPGASLATLFARLFECGVDVPWAAVHEGYTTKRVHAPTYPFQRGARAEAKARVAAASKAEAPSEAEAEAAADAMPGAGAVEAILAAFRHALPARNVKAETDFFDAGGDSLAAVQVVAHVKSVTGGALEVAIADVFALRTPGAIAAKVVSVAEEGVGSAPDTATEAAPTERATYPLTSFQRRMVFLSHLPAEAAAQNLPALVPLPAATEAAAAERALEAVVARHEILRATFHFEEGEPRQAFAADASVDFGAHAVPGGTDAPLPEALRAELAEVQARPFDLTTGPLVRARLLTFADASAVLFLVTHHAVFDGWSMNVVRADLEAALAGRALPPPTARFVDVALAREQGAAHAASESAWRALLAGSPFFVALPEDRPRPATQDTRGGMVRTHLPATAFARAKALAARARVTPFAVCATAIAELLARLSSADDVVFGMPVATRETASRDVVGPFVNTVPVRVTAANGALGDALEATQKAILASLAHKDYPFDQLVDALAVPRRLDRPALFNVFVAYQNVVANAKEGGRLRRTLGLDRAIASYDVSFLLLDVGDLEGLRVEIEYATAIFDARTAERFGAELVGILEAMGEAMAAADTDPFARRVRTLGVRAPVDESRVDLKAVADAPATSPEPTAPDAPAADDALVDAMCRAWAKVLKLEHVAPDADYFDLGGNSFSIFPIVTQLRKVLPGLTVQHFFAKRTPRRIVERLLVEKAEAADRLARRGARATGTG